jgi:hypothetical protein
MDPLPDVLQQQQAASAAAAALVEFDVNSSK